MRFRTAPRIGAQRHKHGNSGQYDDGKRSFSSYRCLGHALPLGVADSAGYDAVSAQLAAETARASAACSMITFRLLAADGVEVSDFDLYLTSGPNYSPGELPKWFFLDRQQNRRSPSRLTYYLDHQVMSQAHELGFRVIARPDKGPVNFAPAEFRSETARVAQVLRPHETALIEIRLDRRLGPSLFKLQLQPRL